MSEAHDGAAEAVTEDTAAATTDATEDQADAQAQEGDSGDDAAAATTDDGEGEQPKPRRSAQERINEAIRAQRDAERDRDFYREQALRQPQTPQKDATAEEAEPNPTDYEHGDLDARFIRDHATFHAKQAFRDEQAKAEANRTQRERLTAFDAAAQAVSEKHPDFFDVVGRDFGKAAALCTDTMREALITSEDGPILAYHLAQTPAEARRIATLSPLAQAVELGKLAAKLATPAGPTAKTATDAPLPTTQVRGAGGQFRVGADTQDFAAFERLADKG